tara:strand:- start:3625 stop:4914 length:1290 start_codon:yes stop_codon:yes gene_type:complete
MSKHYNVLVLGSGGREHAIGWKLNQSRYLGQLFFGPGNAGTASIGKNIPVDINDFISVKKNLIKYKIDILVIGPENPLVNGISDKCNSDPETSNVIVIGPKKRGAMLEGSKSYAKSFMQKYEIPTARYKNFNAENSEEAKMYLEELSAPFVVKADGLAAGKGVYICQSIEEAKVAVDKITVGLKFGEAGKKIVIEEFLDGKEISVFILTNGTEYKVLPIAQDYKRIGENDTGPNTGGMGAVSPVSFVDSELIKKITQQIIKPTIYGIKKEKIEYTGFIFFGLMIVKGQPYVIEYNARLGDPETQAIIPLIDSDLLELFIKIKKNSEFVSLKLKIKTLISLTVILSSGGYPEKYNSGYKITGIDQVEDLIVFHAGIEEKNNCLFTSGGRVLAITSLGKNFKDSLEKAYNGLKKIHFKDMYYRSDIGKNSR